MLAIYQVEIKVINFFSCSRCPLEPLDFIEFFNSGEVKSFLYCDQSVEIINDVLTKLRCGVNVILSQKLSCTYGPWFDRQRIMLQNFFFPPDYYPKSTEILVCPKTDFVSNIKISISIECESYVDIIFFDENVWI
ncbi:hypothetical protein MXB_1505 [Myxobolus squamalis]|nr:hypothetical protein MXB_1505 [Myxobolus squamalis]